MTFPARFLSSTVSIVFLAAVLARLPALGSWWCLDDWGQLAHGAGVLATQEALHARWLSQHLFWSLTWPLFGLHPWPYALLRISLHGIAAVSVVRIARHVGVGRGGALVAGLLFAASPFSFTPVYWASGIQELLAGTLALLAVERWLAPGRTGVVLPVVLGLGSILSKESALGLAVLWGLHTIWRRGHDDRKQRSRWLAVVVLLPAGVVEAILVGRHFATGQGEPYATGGVFVVLGNLGKFGWWLLTQGPVFTGQVTWTLAHIGLGFWGAWAVVATVAWRRGHRLPAVTLLAALLSLAPVLVLKNQVRPYMGYLLMASFSLLVGCLLPKRWWPGRWTMGVLGPAAVVLGLWGMTERIGNRDDAGRVADPVVRAMGISKRSFEYLKEHFPRQDPQGDGMLVVYQPALRARDIEQARRLGSSHVHPTGPYTALDGTSGLLLLAGRRNGAVWVNSLLDVSAGAFVFCEVKSGFAAWGHGHDALVYALLLDIVAGNDQRAQAELRRAMSLDPDLENFHFDERILGVPGPVLRERLSAFLTDGFGPADRADPHTQQAYRFGKRLLKLIPWS